MADEEEVREVLITPEQIDIFENGAMARKAIKLFRILAENKNHALGRVEYTTIRDYLLTTIAMKNAHRSGVSANMTMQEFSKNKVDDKTDNVIIRVKKHKTKRHLGAAIVVLPSKTFDMLKTFVETVRSKIQCNSDLVFVSWNG